MGQKIRSKGVRFFTLARRIMTRVQLFYINVLGSISVDLLMCQSWNFEFRICLLFTEKINFLLVNQENNSLVKLVLRG